MNNEETIVEERQDAAEAQFSEQSNADKTDKSKQKGRREITLSHPATGKTYVVDTPKKVKMGIFETLIELRYGLPPLDIKPWDWKGLAALLVPFIYVIAVAGISLNPYFIASGLLLVIFNQIITRNYFYDFITEKLAKGYETETAEQQAFLEEHNVKKLTLDQWKRKELTKWIIFTGLTIASLLTLLI